MINVVTVDVMRRADRAAIEGGISSLELMRRAAKSIFEASKKRGKTAIVCGPGNNGGDGYALACIMRDKGFDVDVFSLSDKLSEDAYYYKETYIKKGGKPIPFTEETAFEDYDIIYDCIFGTGGGREVTGLYRAAVEKINSSEAFVISADIPSGLNGDNGLPQGIAVEADITVAIGAVKAGHILNDGPDYSGKIISADIGIKTEKCFSLVEDSDIDVSFPERKRNINKGDSGRLVIYAGSSRFMGAAILASHGVSAVRTGAGLVTLAIPEPYVQTVIPLMRNCILFPLPLKDGFIFFDSALAEESIKGANAAAIGMGMGANADTLNFVKFLLNKDITLLIDADGLNVLEGNTDLLIDHKARLILTPHPKEFSRLTGYTVNQILSDPINLAKHYAKEWNSVILLKGSATVITDGERVMIVDRGAPSMAKGGSGDVLSGVIAGIAARGIPPFEAAYSGAYLAGAAGELASRDKGNYSADPMDTAEALYRIIKP
jgi:NAD(P)H-hydrate epimerase